MNATSGQPLTVLAVDGSPAHGGHTRSALDRVSAAAAEAGASVETVAIGADDGDALESLVERLPTADAFILASPVYRATFATPLKRLLDAVPRTYGASPDSPLSGKAVAIVYTGASLHHFLALDSLRSVLAGFFAAHVVPPGLYVPREGFDDQLRLVAPYAEAARQQGEAVVELARLLRESPALNSLRPQA
jgi:FMN reductase